MNFNKKLPVFFHIPKCAGTYINNRCFSFFQQSFGGKSCYHIDVLKDGVITYRLLCTSDKDLCRDYIPINKTCYQINFEDLRLGELNLFLLRVADAGFGTYKKDIYSLLPENIKPYEFLCLREPYLRTQSLYSYIQSSQSSHEDTNYKFGDMSFVDYLNSSQLEGSWLIRKFLKIPNRIPITEEHFKKTCDILNKMLVFGMEDIDESLFKVFMECYGMDCRSIAAKVYDNKTKEKINTPFNSLDERTKTAFLNQTHWDKKLYEKYIH